MKMIIFLLAVLTCCNSWSESIWNIPTDEDREAACRTILYEMNDALSTTENILVLKSVYKLLCIDKFENQSSDHIDIFKEYSKHIAEWDQSPLLENKIACIDTSGYVSSKSGGGFNHRELEKFYYFNDQTNGGWENSEIQTYIKAKPLLNTLGTRGISVMNEFSKSGLNIEDVNNAVQLWKLESFRKATSDIQEINGRIESLNLLGIENIQLNDKFQKNQ
jgi:hypothetical protein